MRNFFRYLIVLSVLAIGFYGASQHRLNDDLTHSIETVEWEEPIPTNDPADPTPVPATPRQTPLAVLIDVDRCQTINEPTNPHATVSNLPEIARRQTTETPPLDSNGPQNSQPKQPKRRVYNQPKPKPVPPLDQRSTLKDSADEQDDQVEDEQDDQVEADSSPGNNTTLAGGSKFALRPDDRPSDVPTGTSPDPNLLGFPLPKLAPRPGDRFAVHDPKEHNRASQDTEDWPEKPGTREMPSSPDRESGDDADADSDAPCEGTEPFRSTTISSTTMHVIEVGDTLPKLAEKYLGDSQLYEAIYLANADILGDPRLLPIGIELRIPSKADLESSADDETGPKPSWTPPDDDPLEDLFREPVSPPQTSSNLEPIPPQALPAHQYEAWRHSIR